MPRKFTEKEYLEFLRSRHEAIRRATETGLKNGAEILLKEAREEVGTYQRDNMGQLPPWAELADRTKAERLNQGFTENDPGLRSGEMRDDYATEVEGNRVSLGNPEPEARWFELGTAKQPPRPVIATALIRKGEEITKLVAKRIAGALRGDQADEV